MELEGPYTYTVATHPEGGYSVRSECGKGNFVAPVTTRSPKLYAFSRNGVLHYIGQTVPGMAARMRLGFQPDGSSGYYGYSWRYHFSEMELHVWRLNGVREEEEWWNLECIEAEVVYAYRARKGQWPESQTEIDFHPTSDAHLKLAEQVYSAIYEPSAQQGHAADARTSRG